MMTNRVWLNRVQGTVAMAVAGHLALWAALVPAATAPGGDAKPVLQLDLPPTAAEAAAEAKRVLVTVNGTELTQGDVDTQISRMMAGRGGGNVPPAQLAQFRSSFQQQIIRNFVGSTLLRQEADRRKLAPTQAEVDKEMADVKTKLPPGASLEELLKQAGMTMETLRQDITTGLKITKLIDEQTAKQATVNDAEIEAAYKEGAEQFNVAEEVQARHILLKCDAGADAKAKTEKKAAAEAIRKQLTDGADFAALAKEKSDCPSGKNGGDLGTFGKGQMVKEFEDAAFTQEMNAIGPVVQTDFGYHIIQVTKHTQARQRPLAEVRDEISRGLKEQKKREVITAYVDELEKKAKIVYPTTPGAAEPAAPLPVPLPAPQK